MTPGRYIRALLALGGLLAAGTSLPARADIYSYVDRDGVHYTNVPVDGRYRLALKEERPPEFHGAPGGGWRERAQHFDALIERAAKSTSLAPALIRAVIAVESAFRPRAVSPKGAQGLMQLHPTTARRYGVADAFDPEQNVAGGARYLADLVERYGTLELALAAYNAGEGAVERYGRKVPPYRETRAYVPTVLKIYRALQGESARHGA